MAVTLFFLATTGYIYFSLMIDILLCILVNIVFICIYLSLFKRRKWSWYVVLILSGIFITLFLIGLPRSLEPQRIVEAVFGLYCLAILRRTSVKKEFGMEKRHCPSNFAK